MSPILPPITMQKGGKYEVNKQNQQVSDDSLSAEDLLKAGQSTNVITLPVEVFQQLLNKLNELSIKLKNLPKTTDSEWMTSEEVMQMLHICSRTLQNWRDQGKIAYSQISKKVILYSKRDVYDLIKINNNEKFK